MKGLTGKKSLGCHPILLREDESDLRKIMRKSLRIKKEERIIFVIHITHSPQGQERILSFEGGSSRSHYVEESF